MDEITRKKNFIINTAYFALIVLIYYVTVKYVVNGLIPFFLAGLVAVMLNRPINNLAKKLRIPRKGAAALILILFYVIVAGVLTLIILRIAWSVLDWFGNLPQLYSSYIEPLVRRAIDFYNEHAINAAGRAGITQTMISDLLRNLSSIVSSISRWAIGVARNMVVGAPATLLQILFSILATVFLCFDYPEISYFAISQFTPKGQRIIYDARRYIRVSVGKMLTSYLVIMCITCVELFTGFSLMQIDDAITLAVIVAIFDILPAAGTGTILLPWALISLLNSEFATALELVVLYTVITVIRNILEPKIVGGSIGLNPVLMLMSMYLGVKLFGAIGILVMPFTIIVIKNLNDSGMISLFNSKYLRDKDKRKAERDVE
jgi:sporulation integral membrane protein YtvI